MSTFILESSVTIGKVPGVYRETALVSYRDDLRSRGTLLSPVFPGGWSVFFLVWPRASAEFSSGRTHSALSVSWIPWVWCYLRLS